MLVTGAGGFIGSHLVETLVRAGAQVRAMVHYSSAGDAGLLAYLERGVLSEIEIVAGDIRDPEMVAETVAGRAAVFHLAALIAIPYSYAAPRSYLETNLLGTLNVLEAARRHGVERIILTSTSEVYGTAQQVPMSEDHPLAAQSPYAASKTAADQLGFAYRDSFGLPIAIARPFNNFGPRQSARAVIPAIISQALVRTTIRLGNVTPIRDFLYVEDAARAFLAMTSESAIGSTVHFGTGRGVSIGELVEKVGAILNKQLEVEADERRLRPERSEVRQLVCDAKKAETLLGWRPVVSLEEGLARTIDFIQAHSHQYPSDSYRL